MSDAACVNLRERFGHTYRITYDPAYSARHVPRDKLDPWMMIIPCRAGEIWPHSGTTLAVELEGRRGVTVRRLLEIGVCRLYRDADDGATLLFDVADFATVAAIIKPRRRRQVSEANRRAARERMLAYNRQKPSPESGSDAPAYVGRPT